MNPIVLYALMGGAAVFVSAITFVVGRRLGIKAQEARQVAAERTVEQTAKRILGEANREAETLRKTAVLSGKEETIRLREEWEKEARGRREEVEREERRVSEKETTLDRKFEILEQRDKELGKRASELGRREKTVAEGQAELDQMVGEERHRLEQLAGITAAEAKAELIKRMEEEAHADAANKLREIRERAKRDADREAKKVVALAVQRIAAEHTAEISVSSVALPDRKSVV